jgi:RNA polymerase sigma factor (sigma-70 family)
MAEHTAAVLGKAIRAAAGRDPAGPSDRELLRRFAAGEQAAFAALFRRHGGMVLGVCRRALPTVQDAEDACQATFLVLARRAGSGRWQSSVANWLYLTARRVAHNARIAARRRSRRERRAAVPESVQPVDRMTGRELLEALDEEVGRLPASYREPLVLCYLEGLTRDEAAARLGLSPATVKIRLERGRKRLGDALTKRGCAGAGLLALAAASASGASPPRLLQAVLASAAGTPPPDVAELARGLAVNGVGRSKLLALLALAGVVVLGVGLGAGRPGATPPETAIHPGAAAPAGAKADAPKAAAKLGNEVTLTGRVLGPDGEPLPGVRLSLVGNDAHPGDLRYFGADGRSGADLGFSGADGRFSVAVPHGRRNAYLVARAEGRGFDFLALDPARAAEVELRLVKDQPIRGRILDTQGRPAAGVSVRVTHVGVYANDSLDAFLAAWKKRHPQSAGPAGVKSLWTPEGPLFAATTDAEGRFTLRGAGAERIVRLRLSKPGIADSDHWVVNHAGFDPGPYNEASRNNIPKGYEHAIPVRLLHGPDLALVAEAEKPIRGVVTAADTGKGRPGVEVRLWSYGDVPVPFPFTTTTDAAGRYEIHGARKEKAYGIIINGDADAGYIGCEVQAADTAGYGPVTADLRTAKGVIVKGRLLDRPTGKVAPGLVPGHASVAVLGDNPFAKDYSGLKNAGHDFRRVTAADGSFRVVTIPGPVLLMGGPAGMEARHRYQQSFGDPKYPQYFPEKVRTDPLFRLYGGAYGSIQGNWCKVLEIKPGTTVIEQDILLEPAAALPLQLRDPAGKPLTGVLATGSSPCEWYPPVTCATDTCTVYDLQPGRPRLVVLFEPIQKLAVALTLRGDEKSAAAVTLRPAGMLRGRLVGADGKPLAGVTVDLNYKDRPAEEIHTIVHRYRQPETGPDGSFALEPVLPGLPFQLSLKRQRTKFFPSANPAATFTVGPGETKDLGNLAVGPLG